MRGWLAMGLMAALGATAQAAERRELGAHEHGHSKLNLAVEGTLVVMEIAAPGLDVLGFEHPAETAADKAAVDAAQSGPGPALEPVRAAGGGRMPRGRGGGGAGAGGARARERGA